MRELTNRRIPRIIALVMAAALIAVMAAARGLASPAEPALGSAEPAPARVAASVSIAAQANDPVIDLCATDGSLALPDSVSVPIWGFVTKPANADCSAVAHTATLPGPVLRVDEGDAVHLNITNGLPAGHRISIEVPGVSFDPGTNEADMGQTVNISFTAPAPGTYLYQSVGEGERQTALGLYGALIVRSQTAGQAYDSVASAYDVEAPLVLSAVDPAFNASADPASSSDPSSFDMRNYQATYWLINGKAYPDTAPIQASAGQRVLLRYVNAGFDNTTMTLLGMHQRVIARDAQLLLNPFDASAETLPAGETEDTIATVPAYSVSTFPHGFALYNRQLHLGNGAPADPATPGGMMTFIQSP